MNWYQVHVAVEAAQDKVEAYRREAAEARAAQAAVRQPAVARARNAVAAAMRRVADWVASDRPLAHPEA